ncbi:phospholipase D, Pld1 [Schizosaccharomyces osmophilus]|uniref:Phospholipase n=1 Tax=Schizosaccharomyces osmophilus TaxID=2545709 RepID=A0AAE9W8D5_9SCHI|nr:phospholipase D, Pld1 [Schizosaccharomyces osmophilus]WBW71606.1 phospholipase D, Pld1 [Schizosaccharomyces osmophilus]
MPINQEVSTQNNDGNNLNSDDLNSQEVVVEPESQNENNDPINQRTGAELPSLQSNSAAPVTQEKTPALARNFLNKLRAASYHTASDAPQNQTNTGTNANFETFYEASQDVDQEQQNSQQRSTFLAPPRTDVDDSANPNRAKKLGARKMWMQLMASVRKLKKESEKGNKEAPDVSVPDIFLAGAPSTLLIAKHFIHDRSSNHVLPVLTGYLHVSVVDVEPKHNRIQSTITMQVEYGSGQNAIRWRIYRQLRDFINLHSHFLVFEFQHHFYGKRMKLPKFPKEVLPYLVKLRGYNRATSGNPDDPLIDETQSLSSLSIESQSAEILQQNENRGHSNVKKKVANFWTIQGNTLGKYLQEMINCLQFFPEVNVLYAFLEMSNMGLRLAGSGRFHGKEGYATVRKNYSASQSILCCSGPSVRSRLHPFWIIVSESSIIFCDSMYSFEPMDVFIWDVDFEITRKKFRKSHPKDTQEKIRVSHHTFKIKNKQKVIKLSVRSGRWLQQFINSVQVAQGLTSWCELHRFDSYAPVRTNVAVQWMVDARDHMWNVSRAFKNAKHTIMIHGWWLTPELQMRRPYSLADKWRIDHLLQEKARQGVRVYIMVYRNIDATIPIDSFHTKSYLQSLHPNIFVIRSPSHFRQNALFWAHHEKLVIVDDAIAFIGGIDLCFGRFDTSQHILYDDKLVNPPDKNVCNEQSWKGKDYSNPRVHDFFDLTQPHKDMYDRTVIPRMGWHDVSMSILGQPARDAARHFVQRWNYLLECKRPARKIPTLIPPVDFTNEQLIEKQLTGTCEVQLLRSAGLWSLGLADSVEQSIHNAYVKCIEKSEHFIYVENQFFITSTISDGTLIENRVGDALVERIIRAYNNNERWKGVIIIPLLPGFQGQIDMQEGSSLRLIVDCQYKSICRGENSIFGRLKARGIDGTKYLKFYGLRGWAHVGPEHELSTDLIYVHAKIMIADDRVAVIGSANINERSLLGNRDSEIAGIVRDTLTIDSKMNGKPYKVGKFAHSLRIRLMREHLGIETDITEQREYNMDGLDRQSEWKRVDAWNPDEDEHVSGSTFDADELNLHYRSDKKFGNVPPEKLAKCHKQMEDFDQRVRLFPKHNVLPNDTSYEKRFEEEHYKNLKKGPTLTANALVGGIPSYLNNDDGSLHELSKFPEFGEDQRPMIRKDPHSKVAEPSRPHCGNGLAFFDDIPLLEVNPLTNEEIPKFDASSFEDPVSEDFFDNIWCKTAENNTLFYRYIFKCIPDDTMLTWDAYQESKKYAQLFKEEQKHWREQENSTEKDEMEKGSSEFQSGVSSENGSFEEETKIKRHFSKGTRKHSMKIPDRRTVYQFLRGIRGHLVELPIHWMASEDASKNWLSGFDKLPPLDIYD